MEPLRPPDHNDMTEAWPFSESQSYKDAQVWKDLKAETGFTSCIDYLELYKDVRLGYKRRLNTIQRLPKDHLTAENHLAASDRSSIVIYDLSEQQDSSIRIILRRHCYSGTELIQALREPPSKTRVQLVLWFFEYRLLDQEMVDALILGLKLDVTFLDNLRTVSSAHPRGPTSKAFRTSQIRSLLVDGTVATISQGFMPDVVNTVPVVLVASIINGEKSTNTLEKILAEGEDEKPPIRRLSYEESMSFERILDGSLERRGRIYARTIDHFVVQDRNATPTKASLLLTALSPLLYAQAYRMTSALNQLQMIYLQICCRTPIAQNRDYLSHDLDLGREELRRLVEATENLVGQTFGYLGSEAHSNWFEEPSCFSIRADLNNLIDRGRRLETEVRHFMRLQTGSLALEESRKSIELSDSQIREARSVKIFTVLAFIYIPLNLATSIFGMNIQQLNGSGQRLWVFFTTAVAALLVTGGSWLCSNRLASHEAIAWYKERAASKVAAKRADDESRKGREYGLLLRIAMVVWLVRSGHTSWMRKSGAWRAILTNSNALGKNRFGADDQRACDYVSKYSRENTDYHFDKDPNRIITWASAASNTAESHRVVTA